MRTLLIGASGFVGRHLVTRLPEAILAGRNPDKIRTQFGAVPIRRWNPAGPPDPALLDGVDAVIHLAGESIFQGRWDTRKKDRIRSSRVDGTRQVVESIATATRRPQVLLCASAIGYYGPRGDTLLTEQTAAGRDFLADVCQAWEAEALRAEEFGVRVVMVRTGVVLGRDGGALRQLLLPFRLGLGGRLGNGRQYMSWIHVEDLVRIILHAFGDAGLRGPVNGVAPHPLTNGEFTQILAQKLHRPAVLPVPAFALRLLLGEFAEVLLGSQRVVPEKLHDAGFHFAFPTLQSALDDLL